MTQDSIRTFVHENFGKDYFPVYHGQTNIVTPLALIVKQKRKWWKRPFGKAEMIILGGLESYIADERKNHFHSFSESRLVKESKSMEKTETGEVSRYVVNLAYPICIVHASIGNVNSHQRAQVCLLFVFCFCDL